MNSRPASGSPQHHGGALAVRLTRRPPPPARLTRKYRKKQTNLCVPLSGTLPCFCALSSRLCYLLSPFARVIIAPPRPCTQSLPTPT